MPSEEEEETFFDIPLVEEPEEEVDNPIVEPYISSKESTMAREGEGEVHNEEGELIIGGGRGRGGNRGGGRGGKGDDRDQDPYDENTTTTMKNI